MPVQKFRSVEEMDRALPPLGASDTRRTLRERRKSLMTAGPKAFNEFR